MVGLVNATALAPGHTLFVDKKVEFPPIPSFAPEHFSILRAESAGKYKQFRRAVDQLDSEGVVQVLRNDIRGDASPVHGRRRPDAVRGGRGADEGRVQRRGPDGAASATRWPGAPTPRRADELGRQRGVEVFTRTDGVLLALVSDKWRLQYIQKEMPEAHARTAGRRGGLASRGADVRSKPRSIDGVRTPPMDRRHYCASTFRPAATICSSSYRCWALASTSGARAPSRRRGR